MRHCHTLALILTATATLSASTFTVGSIQGQNGWSGGTAPISPSVDQEITTAAFRTGNSSFRVSNRAFNGNFTSWIFSPGLSTSVGQPSSGAAADGMTLSFWILAASSTADGSNVEVDFGTVPGDDRNTFLVIRNNLDANGGLQIRLAEPNGPGPNAGFFPTNTMVTGLDRSLWHNISMTYSAFDGPDNDYFTVSVNGGSPIVSPNTNNAFWRTFESFRASGYPLVNRMYIRSGNSPSGINGSFIDANVGGIYFDDVSYSSFNQASPGTLLDSYATSFDAVPEPTTFALSAGAIGVLALLRRRSAL